MKKGRIFFLSTFLVQIKMSLRSMYLLNYHFKKCIFYHFKKYVLLLKRTQRNLTEEIEQRIIISDNWSLYLLILINTLIYLFYFGLVILCIMLLCPSQSVLYTLARLLSHMRPLILLWGQGDLRPQMPLVDVGFCPCGSWRGVGTQQGFHLLPPTTLIYS